MTDATVYDFVNELKKLNAVKSNDIRVINFDTISYTGGDPRELTPPYPFMWSEEDNGFSDLETLKSLNMTPICQVFYVRCESKN